GRAPSNPWPDAFGALYLRQSSTPLPALALNTTALGVGQLVSQANFGLNRPDVFDLLRCDLATRSLTLAQAVHDSARFPYISPAGVVRGGAGDSSSCPVAPQTLGPVWDRLGDGGYVEASGTLAIGLIIQGLIDGGLIREKLPDGTPDPDLGRTHITRDQLRILVLDNSPTNGNSYLCESRGAQSLDAMRTPH